MENKLQVIVDEHDIAKENSKQLIEAFGAPFTEVGNIIEGYRWDDNGELIVTEGTIVVTEETDIKGMKQARDTRLELKKVRTTVENRRKQLKESSLRTGKAIDSVAKFIKDSIRPVEEHLEKQEKFAEIKEAERIVKIRNERLEAITPYCDNPFLYTVEGMTEESFVKLKSDLVDAYNLKVAQAEAYDREQKRLIEEKEEQEAKIIEENNILRKQNEALETEIAKEREEQEEIRSLEVESVKSIIGSEVLLSATNFINALERFNVKGTNNGNSMIDYRSVMEILGNIE
jgi:C4-dicarboxylate-specific signal transduction histidine kinase